MKAIQTGSKFEIYDNSICTYDSLPAATFDVGYTREEGCFLVRRPDVAVTEKAYGIHTSKAEKVLASYKSFDRSLGVILSGDKGIGKSMFAKIVCVRALRENYPVILVDACYPGLARFLQRVDQECVVLFDEFDKTFRSNRDNDEQAALLSLFDGVSGGRKLYIVTCNELYGLNHYIVNRPGRFHYHFRFDYPQPEDVRAYLTDKLIPQAQKEIERVVEFSRKISLNYDCLRAIAFELNAGAAFSDAVADLNIMTTEEDTYIVYLYFENGKSVHNLHYSTNLYDYDGSMTYIRFYDNDGKYVLDADFDKGSMTFDAVRGKVVVPASGIKINPRNDGDDDYDDYDDDEDGTNAAVSGEKKQTFHGAKALYMTFTKRAAKNLHYIV